MSVLPPEWWHFSEYSWYKLVATLSLAEPEAFEMCLDRVNWTPLGGGVTNFSYKVTLQSDKYFVQLVDQRKIERLPGGKFIPSTQVMSSNTKLALWIPQCLLDSLDVRVMKWVDAEPSRRRNFDSDIFVDKVCQCLSVLHKDISTLPFLDIREHLENYYHLAVAKRPDKKENYRASFNEATKYCKSFNASNTCHNDISPGNLLVGDEVYLVDWEYACISDPVLTWPVSASILTLMKPRKIFSSTSTVVISMLFFI